MKACLDKQAMASTYRAQIAKYGVPISQEQYNELRRYAKDHSIRLSGFRAFVGEISVIKTVIDYMPKMYSILKRELSEYSAMYIDGREIVSECFAGYYGKVQNVFANAFVKKCMEIAEIASLSSIYGVIL